ncbi:AsmA family protein [Luminiphilus sp.]|nr:AsmA family protein [Luminiphilus sp.]
MRSLGKLFILIAVLISILAVSALVIKDSDLFRDFVALKLSEVLDRTVSFSKLDIDIDVDQSITIEVDDVVIAQPEGFTGPAFLSLASATLRTTVPNLLLTQPKINSLTLTEPQLHLIQGLDGQPNWKFGGAKTPASSVTGKASSTGLPVFLEHANMKKLQLTLIDSREEARTLHADATLSQDVSGANLSVKGNVNEAPFRAEVTASSADAFASLKDVNLGLDMNLGDVHLSGQVLVGDLRAPARPQVELALQGPSVEYFTDLLNLPPLSQGPLDLSLSVQPGIERMVVRLDGLAGDFSAVISGSVSNLRDLSEVEMAVAISGTDIGRLGDLAGMPNIPHVPFSATGKVIRDQQKLRISDSRINIGRLQIAAGLEIPDLDNPIQANLSAEASVPAIEVFQDVFMLPEGVKGAMTAQIVLESDKQQTHVNSLLITDYGELQAQGQLRGQRELTGTSMTLSAKGNDLGALLLLANQKPGFHDLWSLETDVMVTKNHVELSAGKLSLEGISSAFTAIFPRDNPTAEFSTTHSMTVTNPRRSVSYFLQNDESLALIPSQTLAGSVTADWSTDTLNLRDLTLTLSDMVVEGALTVNPEQKSVIGDLSLRGENLTNVLPQQLLPPGIPPDQLDQALSAESKFSVTPGSFRANDLKLQIGDLAIEGNVQLSEGAVDVDATLAVDNAYAWAVIDESIASKQPLAITGNVDLTQSGSQISFQELTIQTRAGATLHSRGELQLGETFAGTGLEISVDLPDLQRLGWLADLALPKIPLQIEASLEGNKSHLSATTLTVKSSASEFSGRLRVSDPSHPNIQLALHSNMMDLRPLYGPPLAATENRASVSAPSASATSASATSTQSKTTKPKRSRPKNSKTSNKQKKIARTKKVIPVAEINLDILKRFDADVSINIDRFIGKKRRFNNIELISQVRQGRLIVDKAMIRSESDGRIELSGFAVPGDAEHHFGLTIDGTNVRPVLPSAAIELDELTALPPANFSGELSASGNTVRELAQSLTGTAQMTMAEGIIPGELSGFFTNDFLAELLSLLNPLEEEEEFTKLQCAVAFAEVLDGKVKGDPFATVVSEKLAIVSKGQIDLHDEKLFLTFNTVPQKGLGISASSAFNPFIGVAGTLARPQVTLDPEGALVQGSLAVMTGGISLIGKSFIDRLSVSKKSCKKAEDKMVNERAASQQAFESFRKAVLP